MHTDRCGNTRRQKCCAKGSGKEVKIQELCIEIKRMWNLKCTIVPVIIGATGIVTRSIKKNLEIIPRKHSIDSLQKTAILGTSHIIRKVLQCEDWSLSVGDHRWFKRSTRKKCLWQETYVSYNNNNIIITSHSYVLCQLCSKPADEKHVTGYRHINCHCLTHICVVSPSLEK